VSLSVGFLLIWRSLCLRFPINLNQFDEKERQRDKLEEDENRVDDITGTLFDIIEVF